MQCHSILINKKQLTDKAIFCLQCSSVAKQHNILFMSLEKIYLIQECIPVGCVPPTAIIGISTPSPRAGTPEQAPSGRPPCSSHPPTRAGTPRVGIPQSRNLQSRHPLSRYPQSRPLGQALQPEQALPKSRHLPVKRMTDRQV